MRVTDIVVVGEFKFAVQSQRHRVLVSRRCTQIRSLGRPDGLLDHLPQQVCIPPVHPWDGEIIKIRQSQLGPSMLAYMVVALELDILQYAIFGLRPVLICNKIRDRKSMMLPISIIYDLENHTLILL